MSLCYSGTFKKEVKSTRSGADFIFYNFSRLREEAQCCRLDSFGGITFGGNSFWGRKGCLTAKTLWFLSWEHFGFPGNREVQPPKFCLKTKAWPGMLPTITHGQGFTILLAQAVSWWGERYRNVGSAKMWAPVPISLPLTPSTCAGSYSFPDHCFPGLYG